MILAALLIIYIIPGVLYESLAWLGMGCIRQRPIGEFPSPRLGNT